MAATPDLNVDLGELPGEPDELYALAGRVNVACGGHAGDEASMRLACTRARASGALVGAHPGYEDRANFGRVALELPPGEVRALVVSQCKALVEIARPLGVAVVHVKPHGALYHAAQRDLAVAIELVDGALSALGEVAVVGPPEGSLREASLARGLAYLREGFADRRYLADGSLASRKEPDALIVSPERAAEQAATLARTGSYETLCVHADTPGAVAIARAVRSALERIPA